MLININVMLDLTLYSVTVHVSDKLSRMKEEERLELNILISASIRREIE